MAEPFASLQNQPGLHYRLSHTSDGNLSFRYGPSADVSLNRRRFLEAAGFTLEDCVVMACSHRPDIVLVSAEDRGRGAFIGAESIEADALITNQKNLPLFLLIADCLPAIFYDPVQQALAVIHLSWKTTDGQLAARVVNAMQQQFKTNPADLLVSIGPGAQATSYRTLNPEQRELPGWEPYLFDHPDGLTSIDLYGYNQDQLRQAGVPQAQIEISDVDTITSADYFSHYRSQRTGEPEARFAVVASLV